MNNSRSHFGQREELSWIQEANRMMMLMMMTKMRRVCESVKSEDDDSAHLGRRDQEQDGEVAGRTVVHCVQVSTQTKMDKAFGVWRDSHKCFIRR